MKTSNVLAKTNQQENQNHDALFDMRVDTITEGMIPYFAKTILKWAKIRSYVGKGKGQEGAREASKNT